MESTTEWNGSTGDGVQVTTKVQTTAAALMPSLRVAVAKMVRSAMRVAMQSFG